MYGAKLKNEMKAKPLHLPVTLYGMLSALFCGNGTANILLRYSMRWVRCCLMMKTL